MLSVSSIVDYPYLGLISSNHLGVSGDSITAEDANIAEHSNNILCVLCALCGEITPMGHRIAALVFALNTILSGAYFTVTIIFSAFSTELLLVFVVLFVFVVNLSTQLDCVRLYRCSNSVILCIPSRVVAM